MTDPENKTPYKIKIIFKRVISVLLSISTFILLIVLLRWAGFKGILSFIAGLAIMAYLLLSNNIMMRSLITLFGAGKNLKELMNEK